MIELNQKLTNIIDAANLNSFGIRAIMANPKTGVATNYSAGDALPNSHTWVDGETTAEELTGTSALSIDYDGWDVSNIEDSIEQLAPYIDSDTQIVLIGGGESYEGNDPSETVISNAIVLYVF